MDDLNLIKVQQWIIDLNNQVDLDYKGREQVQLLEYMLDEIMGLKDEIRCCYVSECKECGTSYE